MFLKYNYKQPYIEKPGIIRSCLEKDFPTSAAGCIQIY